MFRPTLLLLAVTGHAAQPFDEFVRTSPWLSPPEALERFHLPPGFEIQLVASEPDIAKPISMAFDARGRLWVAETRIYPFESAADKSPRDTIRILSDFAPDGRARKIETFADGLNTPDAVAPAGDGAIVFSIPDIVELRDRDGDGRADERRTLFGPFAHNDTHNMANNFRRGFDGWFYAGHGVANDSRVRGGDGHEVRMRGSTFRFRGDGSRIELVGHGQVNPFGICFDPLGNVFASDCHTLPIYQLIHGASYPGFGLQDDGLGFAPVMMRHSHGSTAIAGLTPYIDNLWPGEFRGNMFLGNVMTCRVNRDRLIETGSTLNAEEMPDLMSSDDPWFRPVDIQLGPDGALYIADFYNRIIAHVEVPLDHPGRDRDSGRIWRVVYRGADGQPALHPIRDFAKAPMDECIAALGDPNLTVRLTVLNLLADRGGDEVIAAARAALAGPAEIRIGALWILDRLGSLKDDELIAAAASPDRAVRTHAMRIVIERAGLSPRLRQSAITATRDPDNLVARTAADALARHPAWENLAPLLALRNRAPQDDTHLVYLSRKALRDPLLDPAIIEKVNRTEWGDADARALADVMIAVPNPQAATFLLGFLSSRDMQRDELITRLRHIARHAPEAGLDALARLVGERFGEDADLQAELFGSVQEGLAQRGIAPNEALRKWGADLAGLLLESANRDPAAWTFRAMEGAPDPRNPWIVQARDSDDGNTASPFLCSLPPGGESLTGTLRSPAFEVPPRLAFWIAGHDGFPDQPRGQRNRVRLVEAESGARLAEAETPRNDLATRVSWDLSDHAGKRGILELIDGDSGAAYAWLAVGRLDPPVVSLPRTSPNERLQRIETAATIAADLNLTALEPQLALVATNPSADLHSRIAAASALLRINAAGHLATAAAQLGDGRIAIDLRLKLGEALVGTRLDEARGIVTAALATAPARLQSPLALSLAASAEGADALIDTVASGKAPASLLAERPIRDRILAVSPDRIARLVELTTSLKPADERLAAVIAERLAGFASAAKDPAKGAAVFQQNCAVCHSIGGEGGTIGPQLDGTGNRGLDRLCEDVLDPNRNVDRIFRYRIVTLKDGGVISGLFRRDEGDVMILADAAGKELRVARADVASEEESTTSLMPEIFADALSPEDFHHLIAYLLSHSASTAAE